MGMYDTERKGSLKLYIFYFLLIIYNYYLEIESWCVKDFLY